MECDICQRENSVNVPFYCVSCARNAIYLPRLENAQILLEKSTLAEQVEKTISTDVEHTDTSSNLPAVGEGRAFWQVEVQQVEANDIKHRLDQIKQDKSHIRQESQGLRDQIQELKKKIAAKKKALQVLQSTLPKQQEAKMMDLSNSLAKLSSQSTRVTEKFTSNRGIICREAADLMRLRQRRRPKEVGGKEQYSIAGLTLPDLRQITHIRCTDLSAVLGSVARLLVLVAFYLGVRLPAEITLPHSDYPFTTINLPKSSYLGKKAETSPPNGTHDQSSPSASKYESGIVVVPRPLFLGSPNKFDERVFQFQQKHENTFNHFIEGIALLAWSVAWLCRSQGFFSGTNTWEDICDIGKNLHSLIITQSSIPTLTRLASDRAERRTSHQAGASPSPRQLLRRDAAAVLGKHSDSTSINQGSAYEKSENLLSWKYSGWQAVAAPLRKVLYEENVSAEWELLKEQEWDDGGEQFDEAVFVKSRTLDGQQYDDARSIMTTRTRIEEDNTAANRIPGTSGWTKLKSRDKS